MYHFPQVGTPPFVSGLGFVLLGLYLFIFGKICLSDNGSVKLKKDKKAKKEKKVKKEKDKKVKKSKKNKYDGNY